MIDVQVVDEQAERQAQTVIQPSLPHAVDDAVRADGRPEHRRRVGHDTERQSGDGRRAARVPLDHGAHLQPLAAVLVVRELAGGVRACRP